MSEAEPLHPGENRKEYHDTHRTPIYIFIASSVALVLIVGAWLLPSPVQTNSSRAGECTVSIVLPNDIVGASSACTRVTPATFHEAEGPVWIESPPQVVFSDVVGNTLWSWSYDTEKLTALREGAGKPNGNVVIGSHLYTLEQAATMGKPSGAVVVSDLENAAHAKVLVETYKGKPFASPNDIIAKADGSLWFTDACYSRDPVEGSGSEPAQPLGVYMLPPGASEPVRVGGDDLRCPNGLAFTPDGSLLVADSGALTASIQGRWSYDSSGPREVRKYRVGKDQMLEFQSVFAEMPGDDFSFPDGVKVDGDGYVYVGSQASGVRIYSPEGDLLATITTPLNAINVVIGGPKRDKLFITATNALYRLDLTSTRSATAV
eukprot:NODE_11324_length_1294_cov_5.145673.p1 GENE.NODE_11324_length_1294_cov_5.145673~~NODE_11324_length_1294_cov_5.145673.p1  ORF type:complete len:376 (+),score=66.13 NODE_11324_length_1294_cov_5.145673:105-1232(+)